MYSFKEVPDCFSVNRYLFDFIGHFSLICIPIFGLLSGYLLVYHEIRYRKLLPMWLMVYFYSIFGELIAVALGYQKHIYWYAFFPVLRCRWWYVTAYFILFIFLKFLNPYLKKMNTVSCIQYTFLMLIILVTNPFTIATSAVTGGGFSALKLMCLYVLGACLRRFHDDTALVNRFSFLFRKISYSCFLKILLLVLVIFYLGLLYFPYALPQIPKRFYDFLTADFYAPFNLGVVILLFLLFCTKAHSKLHWGLKIFAPVALDVYIIHMHPCLVGLVFTSCKILNLTQASTAEFLLYFCIRVMAIIGVCTCIAWGRKFLFARLHISEYCNQFADKITQKINSIVPAVK